MLEQEIASLIKHVLANAGNPAPYYDEVPEGFIVPAAYFPQPEITSDGDTLLTYALSYTWFVKLFHSDGPSAYALGLSVLTALQDAKNIVPLIGLNGAYTGRGFRLKDPSLKRLDGSPGVAQLTLSWNSPRPYRDAKAQKMMTYDLNMYSRDAYESAVRQIGGNDGGKNETRTGRTGDEG